MVVVGAAVVVVGAVVVVVGATVVVVGAGPLPLNTVALSTLTAPMLVLVRRSSMVREPAVKVTGRSMVRHEFPAPQPPVAGRVSDET